MSGQGDSDVLLALGHDILGSAATISVLRTSSRVSDGTAILLVHDGRFRRILQISPADHPDVVVEGCDRARAFADRIGPVLGGAVLLPLDEGRVAQRSFALLRYHPPFVSTRIGWWWQRRRVTPAMLDWLGKVASFREAGAQTYRRKLAALIAINEIRADIADAAVNAIKALDEGMVTPCHVPMHGDLWRGNILTAPPENVYPFILIDWRGSAVAGYPIFDLIRLAASYRLPPARLRGELGRHAELLGCPLALTQVHLLAALGHYARHIGEMPVEAFNRMAASCFDTHRRAITA